MIQENGKTFEKLQYEKDTKWYEDNQQKSRDQEELDLLKSLSSLPRRLDPPAGPRPLLCACPAADARWRRHAPCQCPRRTT